MAISPEIRSLMAPEAAAMEPYDPAFAPVELNLSANENGRGLPASIRADVDAALSATATERYPRPLADALRAELASWQGVSPEELIVGNGGDELIFNLFLAFGGAGRSVLVSPPTFSVYRLYAELLGCEVVEVPLAGPSFSFDEEAFVEAARTADIAIVCSPNNPTGTLAPEGFIERVCEACPGIVLADEAYIEFADAESAIGLVERYPRLAVLRTLSKAFAMAGARVGYVVSSEGVVSALAAVRQPYSVNVFSQAAALAVLGRKDEMLACAEEIARERTRFAEGLAAIGGVEVFDSSANFVLIRVKGAERIWERLRDEYSILVRNCSAERGAQDCLRITVGTPQEDDRVLKALSRICQEEA